MAKKTAAEKWVEENEKQIKEWKNDHERVVLAENKESGRFAVVHSPDMKTLDAALVAGRNGGLGTARVLYTNCKLYESEGVNTEDLKAFYTLVKEEFVTVPECDVKEL